MLFQPLFNYSAPFVASVTKLCDFPLHLHHEIEMLYCIDNGFTAVIGGHELSVGPGQLIAIGSMAPHEIVCDQPAHILIIELGPAFLQSRFSALSGLERKACVFSLSGDGLSERRCALRDIIREIIAECPKNSPYSVLTVTGDLYRLCAVISEECKAAPENRPGETVTLQISKALELIYNHYREPLTVEYAAKMTGWGKSNFCRIFKKSVGMSFHAYLNLFRVNNAEYFLAETDMSIGEISEMCGFSDQKSFCRVFRAVRGMTPSEYRTRCQG